MPKRDPDSNLPLSLHDLLFAEKEKLAKLNDKLCNLSDDTWLRDEVEKTKGKRDDQEMVVAVLVRAGQDLGLLDEDGQKIDHRNGQLQIVFDRDRDGDDGEQLEFGPMEQPGPAASDESDLGVEKPERRPNRPRRVRDAEPVEA